MKKTLLHALLLCGSLALPQAARADHDKSCKNVHGKVTVVTEEGLAVNDKMYKVSKSTRITKGEKRVKLDTVAAGDLVCIDTRGKDDIGDGGVAAVTVLGDPAATGEKQYVREKETVRQIGHDKQCTHAHGRVTRVADGTLIVDSKPYILRETTRISKDGKVAKIETIKTGDFVCLDADEKDPAHKLTTITVLAPADAAPYELKEKEIIREREELKIREQK